MKMPLLTSAQKAFYRKDKWLTYKDFLMQENREFKMKSREQVTTKKSLFNGSHMHT